jgi:hypothetical protein
MLTRHVPGDRASDVSRYAYADEAFRAYLEGSGRRARVPPGLK